MNNTGIILTLAYPDTIVTVSEEWFSPYLRFIGVGKKNYLRAGHAALVLINKSTGLLEYHDFGRYITPEPNGRVRGRDTDHELEFPLKATIVNDSIKNLDEILEFLATHSKFTHGEGKLVASVCDQVDYQKARTHITMMQRRDFIRYAAFINDACNCARFVTDSLIASVTNPKIKKRLIGSKWFTPSTVGNVLLADSKNEVFEVSEQGEISEFKGSQRSENIRCFLDKLKDHQPSFEGTLTPTHNDIKHGHAQWLSGIAAGAWFELHKTERREIYRYRRISPNGHIDCDKLFVINNTTFEYEDAYTFVHYSNCKFFHIEQKNTIYRFDSTEDS